MKIDNSKIYTADIYRVDIEGEPLIKNTIVVKIGNYYAHITDVTRFFKYKKLESDAEKGEALTDLMSTVPDQYQSRYVRNVKPKFTEQGKTSARKLCKTLPKIVGRDIEW